jgi:excisionase family DNA binding protein
MHLLPVSRVARILACSPATVRGLIHRGRLPGAVRVGSEWRISAEALSEFIAAGGSL